MIKTFVHYQWKGEMPLRASFLGDILAAEQDLHGPALQQAAVCLRCAPEAQRQSLQD
jgi:hypothetical protein